MCTYCAVYIFLLFIVSAFLRHKLRHLVQHREICLEERIVKADNLGAFYRFGVTAVVDLNCVRAISHWSEYSLRVLAEKVISLVLPLSIHTDASARIPRASRASTRGHSR